MIDIHSHIVFGVDDGPKTIEESKALLEESYRQGVRTIVSTSHRRKGMFETPEEIIDKNFEQVQEMAKTIAEDLAILYGAEIYYSSDALDKLEKNLIPSLGGTRYLLIEFSYNISYKEIYQAVTNVQRLGYRPVVAHIERYHVLENRGDLVEELIDLGCYMQINSSSVLKPKLFGDKQKVRKKRARYFLDQNLVHFVASDMHHVETRPSYMDRAFDIIRKDYGRQRARDLFTENARILLSNQEIG